METELETLKNHGQSGPTGGDQEQSETSFSRYIPLACWVLVLLTFAFIPLRIIGYGTVPPGDARYYIGSAVGGKSCTDVIVMRPEYKMDPSPGWVWLLRFLHVHAGLSQDGLVSFAIFTLLSGLFLPPLIFLRRPEAWMAALLAQLLALPDLMGRFIQARPFEITEGVLLVLLFAWSRPGLKRPGGRMFLLSCAGFALSTWMHGTWYLWELLPAAFIMAGEWRKAGWLMVCWAVGAFVGGLLTGHPIDFLAQQLMVARNAAGERVPSWMLVGEFNPSTGEFATLVLVAVVFLWRKHQRADPARLYCRPVLWLAAIGWTLGFWADRFWADWGLPAVLVWLAIQFDDAAEQAVNAGSLRRLLLTAVVALPLALHATNDLDSRYTKSLRESFLDTKAPELKGWFPGPGGIFYCAEQGFFYNTFYKNPTGDWRYVLGFGTSTMTRENLEVLHNIFLCRGVPKAYEPWLRKMRPQDRLVIYSSGPPDFPELEWHEASANIWLGRLGKDRAR